MTVVSPPVAEPRPPAPIDAAALAAVAAGADELDRHPRFPTEAFDALRAAGALALTVPGPGGARPVPLAMEWAAVRAVAAADGSVGRIYDGHLNGVDRLAAVAPEPLRSAELARVAAGELRLGVWGADPGPGEGEPAEVVDGPDGLVLVGAKTFCSGAGGLQRALVLARGDGAPPPLLAYVDLTDPERAAVDRLWYRAAGMRASESHRVQFRGARVLALLGGPGEIAREPFFGLDALRTAASWAGLADAIHDEALAGLRGRPGTAEDPLAARAAGRMGALRETIDAWFERAAARREAEPDAPAFALSVRLRAAVEEAARALSAEAARALGSRPLVTGSRLDRARRDLEVFLLQHRLDPLLARIGAEALRG